MTAYHLSLAGEDKKKKGRKQEWFFSLWDIVSMLYLMHEVIY